MTSAEQLAEQLAGRCAAQIAGTAWINPICTGKRGHDGPHRWREDESSAWMKLWTDLQEAIAAAPPVSVAGVCRVCGCTDSRPCIIDGAGDLVDVGDDELTQPNGCTTCSWVEIDLCSNCVADKVPALLVDGNGNPLRGAP